MSDAKWGRIQRKWAWFWRKWDWIRVGYLHVVNKILHVKVIGAQIYNWVECWF
jgi:hypothetical protein